MEKSRPTALIRTGIVLVVAHDAGGAEILSSLLRSRTIPYKLSLDGPAIPIFKRKLGNIVNLSLDKGIELSDWVMTGTGWASDFEYQAIRKAKKSRKFVVSFLDHWVNYRNRFVRSGETCLPDEIWVGDHSAFTFASECFRETTIKFLKNPSFDDFLKEYAGLHKENTCKSGKRLLFLSDNLEEALRYQHKDITKWGYSDRDSFMYLMNNLDKLGEKIDRITIRPHPSEPCKNFDWAVARFAPSVVLSKGVKLVDELVEHEIVAGSESMAMVIALLCGKRVVCSIPPAGKACSLPHTKIEMLRCVAG